MSLDVARLKGKIKIAYQNAQNQSLNADQSLDAFCDELAIAIVYEIKQAKIVYTAGLFAGSVPVTGSINHTVL